MKTKCVFWTGYKQPAGYGSVYLNGKVFGAHRLAWIVRAGRAPKPGMDICHTCDNRLCVNPDHLFEGTRSDNMRDASEKGRIVNQNTNKTHCKRGHEFTKENTRTTKDGGRSCKQCANDRFKETYVPHPLPPRIDRQKVYKLRDAGLSLRKIAKELNCSAGCVWNALKARRV